MCVCVCVWCNSPQWVTASSLSRLHDHTQTHQARYDSTGRVISPTQRPPPENTQYLHKTNIRATGGIRTHNASNREVAEPRLRRRGHWDRRNRNNITIVPSYPATFFF